MWDNFLEILWCPGCQSSLDLKNPSQSRGWIEGGYLSCEKCSITYPIAEGVPRFVSQMEGATQERFAFEWMRYPGSLPEDEKVFLEETQIEMSQWKNKWVLDAGCGMGRYARVAHALGANLVALDLGSSLIRLNDLARKDRRFHLVQGDLLYLPLKDQKFDIIYSLGVIHHTPSPKGCVKELTSRLKDKGKLTLWVYGTAGYYCHFKTNPLKEERKFLTKFLWFVWAVVKMREFFSEALRAVAVHLSHTLLYFLCYPLAWIGAIPLLKYLTFSVHSLWRVRLQENFDWLAPPYQSHHTKEEVREWFEENDLSVLNVLPHGFVPKVGLLGEKN